MKRVVSIIVLLLLFVGLLALANDIEPVKSIWVGAVYIRADGSIEPPDAPIITYDNITYMLKSNITSSDYGIIIEKDDIVIDGAGFEVAGTGYGIGIDLSNRINVTVKSITVKNFQTGILLNNSLSNNIFENNLITNKWYGVYLENSNNSKIIQNRIEKNRHGVVLLHSKNNSIKTNNIKANDEVGVYIGSSSLNSIFNNNLMGNTYAVYLEFSCNNTILGNNIVNNQYGVWVCRSNDNTFHHNNFIDNSYQIFDQSWAHPFVPPSVNVWGDYPSGGNYWSDYVGVDYYSGLYQNETGSDGIGDTPYNIGVIVNLDMYPLMGFVNIFYIYEEDQFTLKLPILIISNSTILDFKFIKTQGMLCFNVLGEGGVGFCRLTLPYYPLLSNIWHDNYTVLIDGSPPLYIRNWTEEDFPHFPAMHIYFTYQCPAQKVIIIPEFPSIMILTVFLALSLTIMLWKNPWKKKQCSTPLV